MAADGHEKTSNGFALLQQLTSEIGEYLIWYIINFIIINLRSPNLRFWSFCDQRKPPILDSIHSCFRPTHLLPLLPHYFEQKNKLGLIELDLNVDTVGLYKLFF